MDTNKLKRFATEARNKIRQGVVKKLLALGFNEEGEPSAFPQQLQGATLYRGQQREEEFYNQWLSLYEAIQHHGVKQVYEEVAYTWFNRLVAIRILQKNGFIDRVLTFDNPEIRVPHIVSEARQGRFPEMNTAMRLRLRGIISDPSKTYEQFALLITAFCQDSRILSTCFGAINDYTSLLLPDDILDADGFVDMLNRADYISDEDYRTTELLGWLYQFYISERKDNVFASFKKGHKAEAEDIAPATQIFTPNWIVKYMVQNTLGRIWLDNNPGDSLEYKMQYLVPKAEDSNEDSIYRYDSLEDIKVIDPACGSGHILLEAFDLLYDMYLSEFYSREEAITCIFTKNLVGIDLDTRAKQLATFALLLKACQRDKSFLDVSVSPRVLNMPVCDSYTLKETLGHFLCAYQMEWNDAGNEELAQAFGLMKDADSLGSIMRFDISGKTRQLLVEAVASYDAEPKFEKAFKPLVDGFRLILALTDKYACVIANPPYMGSGNMNEVLSKYVKDNYAEGKADLFSVFMMLAIDSLVLNGKYGMINMHSWMFLASFERLRQTIINQYQVENMLHLGTRTFVELSGEVVQNTTFVISNTAPLHKGIFYNLCDGDCNEKEVDFLTGKTKRYVLNQKAFLNVPGLTFAYWLNEKYFDIISLHKSLGDISEPRAGLQTSDNLRFLRIWSEVNFKKIGLNLTRKEALDSAFKWFPHNKGGETRKWYGNRDIIINFENDGEELKYWLEHNPKDPTTKSWSRNLRNYPLYFNEGLTWGGMGNTINVRYSPQGSTFDTSGPMLFTEKNLFYILGLTNSNVFDKFVSIFAQGLSKGSGHFAKVPFILNNSELIESITKNNVEISRADWDAHETSWDFKTNELLRIATETDPIRASIEGEIVQQYYSLRMLIDYYKAHWKHNFMQLHDNEEELNRQFISIYGLEDELTPDVPLDEITILQQGEITIADNKMQWHDDVIIKQFISYAIGCMMGRYSIDKPGLILANQGDGVAQYNQIVPNSRFAIDDDGILPLMDDNSPFSDNAASRLAAFVKTAFGADHLTENLNFMEQALGKSLNEYLQKDFWKDHKRMYQSRPIYWLFASKKGAFRALVYMHRMDAYTVGKVRNQYLLPYIEWLKQRIDELMARQAELSAQERKQLKDYGKSLDECREYDVRLHEVANQQISIDLDDGVVVNYAKYGDVLQKLK